MNRGDNMFSIWISRVGAVAFSAMSLLVLASLVDGFTSGCIRTLSKYSSSIVCLGEKPIGFYSTVSFHLAILVLLLPLSYRYLVNAGWVKGSAQIESAIRRVEERVPDPNKPLPRWFIVIVVGGFLCLLLSMCKKGVS